MRKAELVLENETLREKLEAATLKNRILSEAASFYADPLVEWDKGETARKAISKAARRYKPVTNEMAVMFRQKEVYPFVEIGSFIEDAGEGDEQ